MKEKGSRKVNFPEAIILLVIVVFIMIWTTLIGQIPTAVGFYIARPYAEFTAKYSGIRGMKCSKISFM